jgi:transposase
MKPTTIAVDIAKEVFQIAVSIHPGMVAESHRFRRDAFLEFFVNRPVSTVVMEACGTAHYWARRIQELGHEVILLPPHLVRPYVQRTKNDRADAKAILEACRNADIRPVPIKTLPQQVLSSQHRIRSGWIGDRTRQINTLRGLLRELGHFINVGRENVLPSVLEILDQGNIPPQLQTSLRALVDDIATLDARIETIDTEIEEAGRQIPLVRLLYSIPAIGMLTATALFAFVGDFSRFPSGRHLASFLGLTPREKSSGEKQRLGRISKKGDTYLRMMLIHGARSILGHMRRRNTYGRLGEWALELCKRAHFNKVTAALAAKIVRIVRAVAIHGQPYAAESSAA